MKTLLTLCLSTLLLTGHASAASAGFDHACDQAALSLVDQAFGPLDQNSVKVLDAKILREKSGGPVVEQIKIRLGGDVRGYLIMSATGDDSDSCRAQTIAISLR